MHFGKETADLADQLGLKDILAKKNSMLWWKDAKITIQPSPQFASVANDMSLFPFVQVTLLTKDDMSQMTNAALKFKENLENKNPVIALTKLLNKLESKDDEKSPDEDADKVKLIEAYSNLYSSDFTGFMLLDELFRSRFLSLFYNSDWKVDSVQKKGNVVYMKITNGFTEQDNNNIPTIKTYLDEEIFIFSYADNCLFIKISIPSIDGRSDAYLWTQEWLCSLKVVLN